MGYICVCLPDLGLLSVGDVLVQADPSVVATPHAPWRLDQLGFYGAGSSEPDTSHSLVGPNRLVPSVQRSCGCGGSSGSCSCGGEESAEELPVQGQFSARAPGVSPGSVLALQRLVGSQAASAFVRRPPSPSWGRSLVPSFRSESAAGSSAEIERNPTQDQMPVQRTALDEFLARGQDPAGERETGCWCRGGQRKRPRRRRLSRSTATAGAGGAPGRNEGTASGGEGAGLEPAGSAGVDAGGGGGASSPGESAGSEGSGATGASNGEAAAGSSDVGGTATSGAGDLVSDVGTSVAGAIGAIGDEVSSAVSWLESEAGKVALSLASSLASRLGAKITVVGSAIHIDIPEIDLLDAEQSPVVELPRAVLPVLLAAGVLGPARQPCSVSSRWK